MTGLAVREPPRCVLKQHHVQIQTRERLGWWLKSEIIFTIGFSVVGIPVDGDRFERGAELNKIGDPHERWQGDGGDY